MHTASVDSILQIRAYAFSQHSKGNLLYFATRAQSTMEYLPKAVKDEVVDSSPSHAIPVVVNSSSPLWSKATVEFPKSKWQENNGAQRNLYQIENHI